VLACFVSERLDELLRDIERHANRAVRDRLYPRDGKCVEFNCHDQIALK
jgi:hypothetical protein